MSVTTKSGKTVFPVAKKATKTGLDLIKDLVNASKNVDKTELEAAEDILKMNPSLQKEAFEVPVTNIDELAEMQKAQTKAYKKQFKDAEKIRKQDTKETLKQVDEKSIPRDAKSSGEFFEESGLVPFEPIPGSKELKAFKIPKAINLGEKAVDNTIRETIAAGKSVLDIDPKQFKNSPEATKRLAYWMVLERKNPQAIQAIRLKQTKTVSENVKSAVQAGQLEDIEGIASSVLPKGKQTLLKNTPKLPDIPTGRAKAPAFSEPIIASAKPPYTAVKEELQPFGSHIQNLGDIPDNSLLSLARNNPEVLKRFGITSAAVGTGALAVGSIPSGSKFEQQSPLGGGSGGNIGGQAVYDALYGDANAGTSPLMMDDQQESEEDIVSEIPDMDEVVEQESTETIEEPTQPSEQPVSKVQALANLLATEKDNTKYQEALDRRDLNILANRLGQAGEIIGTSISQTKPVAQQIFEKNIEKASQIPEDFQQQIAMNMYDPESAVSKNYREFLKRYGVNVDENVTAAQVKDTLLPAVEKELTAKQRAAERKDVLEYRRQTTSINKAKSQLETAKKNALNSVGGGAGNTLRNRIVAADAIFSTVGIDPDIDEKTVDTMDRKELDKLPRQFIAELTVELNRMLTGTGIPAQSTFKKMLPNNFQMDKTAVQDYLTSKLNPSQQAEFAKLVLKTAVRVKHNSKKSLAHLVKQSFSGTSHIKEQLPEDYAEVIKALDVDMSLADTEVEKDPQIEAYAKQHKLTYEQAFGIILSRQGSK